MPRVATPHPTYATIEEFLEGMTKESDEVRQYYFKQIQFAEKERLRYSEKAKKRYQKLKDKAQKLDKLESEVEAEIKAQMKAKKEEQVKEQEVVQPKSEPPIRKMPEYIEPRNLPIIKTTKKELKAE